MKAASEIVDLTPSSQMPRISAAGFFVTSETGAVLASAFADRRLAKSAVGLHEGGMEAASRRYSTTPPPNLIIVETTDDAPVMLERLDQLAQECVQDTKVIVIGHMNDVAIYRDLMERGVTDYLVAPTDAAAIFSAVAKVFQPGRAAKLGKVTAFMGTRGGSGSSTVSHNVAFAASKLYDENVYLADLDLSFGTAGLDFDLDPTRGMGDVLQASGSLDQALLDKLSARRGDRLHVIAAAATFDNPYDVTEKDVGHVMEIAKSGSGHTVMDLPHVWTAWTKAALKSADNIVLTVTPDLTSMRNAKHVIDYLRASRPNDDDPVVVLNQIGIPRRPEIKPDDLEAALGCSPKAFIRFDAMLFGKAANKGQPIVETAPKSSAAKTFSEIAALTSGKAEVTSNHRGFLSKLLGRA